MSSLAGNADCSGTDCGGSECGGHTSADSGTPEANPQSTVNTSFLIVMLQ